MSEKTGMTREDLAAYRGQTESAHEPPVTLEQCREMFGLPPEQDPLIDKLERELSDTREAYLNQSARLIQAEMTQELPYAWVRSDGGCFEFSRDDARPGGKGWIPLYRRAGDSPPVALRAPIDGPFEVWFKPIDGTRGVLDERNGITLQVFGFVDTDEHRKYCEELAATLNARTSQPPGVQLAADEVVFWQCSDKECNRFCRQFDTVCWGCKKPRSTSTKGSARCVACDGSGHEDANGRKGACRACGGTGQGEGSAP